LHSFSRPCILKLRTSGELCSYSEWSKEPRRFSSPYMEAWRFLSFRPISSINARCSRESGPLSVLNAAISLTKRVWNLLACINSKSRSACANRRVSRQYPRVWC
jgi:hypothetical protein